jgi:glycosyltransferase involved in cell wall biosynthesis
LPAILFLDHTAALGGAELFLLELAKGFRDEGKVLLFQDGPLRALLIAERVGVQVFETTSAVTGVGRGGKGLAQLRASPGAYRLARRIATAAKRFDVIFANRQKCLIVGALVSWISRKPLVWYLHDTVTADHFSAVNRRLCVWVGNRFAAQIVTNSEASKLAFVAAGGRKVGVSVVYNGIDAAAFEKHGLSSREKIRRALGIAKDTSVIGVFSRLAPWKGQHIFLEALAGLPGVHGLLVGAPLFREAGYEEELRTSVTRLGLGGRIHFLGFREDIPALLQAVDVAVHTSIAPEPFGRVIVEGMLAGKPVIATRAGGACEIIVDQVTGRLVQPGDPIELASALKDLLQEPEKASAMATAGFLSARERFSVQKMIEGIQQVTACAMGGRATSKG